MGRTGPRLVPFLKEGLRYNKYRILQFKGNSRTVFSISFPHKTGKLLKSDQLIFKDWYARDGRLYRFGKDYTKARQAMTASLNRSVYLAKVKSKDDVLTFRILSADEVKEKRRLKKEKEAIERIEWKKKGRRVNEESDSDYAPPSVDSGYSGSICSPKGHEDNVLIDEELVQAIEHDHAFGFTLQSKPLLEENIVQYNLNASVTSFVEIVEELMDSCSSSNENVSFIEQPSFNHEYDIEINKRPTISLQLMDDFNASSEIMNEYSSEQPENIELEDLDKLELKELPILDPKERSALFEDFTSDPNEFSQGLLEMNKSNGAKVGTMLYLAKKFDYCGKVLVLFCEPLELGACSSEHSGELKIFFDGVVMNEARFKRVKEHKFIGDHMLVFLDPNNDY